MVDLKLLEDFTGPDEAKARVAADRLYPMIRAFICSHLSISTIRRDKHEDIVATTIQRLWRNRRSIEIRGVSQWWAYVNLAARRVTIDLCKEAVESEIFEDVVAAEQAIIEEEIERRESQQSLYRYADDFWLDAKLDESDLDRLRRLLAMKMHFLGKENWRTILQQTRISDRTTLDRILEEPRSFFALAYSELHLSPQELVKTIQETLERDQVEEERANLIIDVLTLRLCHGRNSMKDIARILSSRYPGLTEADVKGAYKEGVARISFVKRMTLLMCIQEAHFKTSNVLKNSKLWKRLVFQYSTRYELAHKAINDLLGPPAQLPPFKLTESMLNIWISGNRLHDSLTRYIQKRLSDE